MAPDDIAAKIAQRRRQILVHSILYYRFGDIIIPDYKWAEWAKELTVLQEQYPEIAEQGPYAEAFKGFDPSTGYNLPLGDPAAYSRAVWLLDYHYQHYRRNE